MYLEGLLRKKFLNLSSFFGIFETTGLCLMVLALNGCFAVNKGEVFPHQLPDAIANEPYSTVIDISGGAIKRKADLYVGATPAPSYISYSPIEKGYYNAIFLHAMFKQKGLYTIKLLGFGYSPKPLQLDNNMILNVLSPSSVCNYQNVSYNHSKNKKYKYDEHSASVYQLLPQAIIRQEYIHHVQLYSSNVTNMTFSRKDVKLTIFPENSGLQVRPLNNNSYNTIELYGKPKAIGSIVLEVDLNKIPDPQISPVRYFIVPVFPDQSHCQ